MKENGINEIYFYGYYMLDKAEDRKLLHDFIVRANANGKSGLLTQYPGRLVSLYRKAGKALTDG